MLAKKSVENRITLPERILEQLPPTEYFDVQVESGTVVLRPVPIDRSARVRDKLASLGITEKDIEEAVHWARSRK